MPLQHPVLRNSISAQAGALSPWQSQPIALAGLPVSLPLSYIPRSSFPLGWHELPSSATSDQTTRWTLGLTEPVFHCSDCAGLCQSWEKPCLSNTQLPACSSLQSSPALYCSLTDNFKEPVVHAKTSISRLLTYAKTKQLW